MKQINQNAIRQRTLFVARTGVLTALLVVLQWATAGTQVFAGQYITGTLVNTVLAVSALAAGLWSGVTVAILSPFCARLFGIGPQLPQIIPAISVGNLVFVTALYFLTGAGSSGRWRNAAALLAAAAAKFLTLYLLVVRLIVPVLAGGLKPQQIAVFSVMFSYPQLITAFAGGAVALLILPLLKRAVRHP